MVLSMTIILESKSWQKNLKDNLNTLKKTVPINKESENNKTITYKIKLIDSFRFISSSLLNLVNNPLRGIHNNK